MKKFYILSTLILLLISQSIFAEKVKIEVAEKIAKNFYYQKTNTFYKTISFSDIKVNEVFTEKNTKNIIYYIFNINEGHVIVYADNDLNPVIGYSLNNKYNPYNLSPNYKSWMHTYVDKYNWVKEKGIKADKKTKTQWDNLININYMKSSFSKDETTEIAPLLKSYWNQDKYYNQYCPKDEAGSGGYTYAGCVATAMSQIMYYYRYPLHGSGTKSYTHNTYGDLSVDFENTYYRWDEMEDNLNSENTAVAELMYQCGISVLMNYSAEGSGAYSTDVPNAIKTYFNYYITSKYISKSNFTDSEWESKMISQLDLLQPIFYSGHKTEGEGEDAVTSGHAFICDGYQEGSSEDARYFHFDFGYDGYSNGYFLLSEPLGFEDGQGAVINFKPDPIKYPYYCTGENIITSNNGTITDGSGPINDYQNNTNCSWLIAPNDSVNYISIIFNEFDTEDINDILTIYDGENTSAPILGTYSGSSIPEIINSTGSKLFVTFTSNESITSKGFYLSFKSHIHSWCNDFLTLTNNTDTISDGSENFDYINKSNCGWIIEPDNATTVTLHFLSFNTEEKNDHLQIFDSSNNELLADYSGSSIPDAVTSPSGGMNILFKSNYCITGEGWTAYYTINNDGINDNINIKSINIFPNPIKDNFNLTFNAQGVKNLSVKIISMDGKIMYSENIENITGNYNKYIDVKSFSKGIYILNISDENSNINKKIILQ